LNNGNGRRVTCEGIRENRPKPRAIIENKYRTRAYIYIGVNCNDAHCPTTTKRFAVPFTVPSSVVPVISDDADDRRARALLNKSVRSRRARCARGQSEKKEYAPKIMEIILNYNTTGVSLTSSIDLVTRTVFSRIRPARSQLGRTIYCTLYKPRAYCGRDLVNLSSSPPHPATCTDQRFNYNGRRTTRQGGGA